MYLSTFSSARHSPVYPKLRFNHTCYVHYVPLVSSPRRPIVVVIVSHLLRLNRSWATHSPLSSTQNPPITSLSPAPPPDQLSAAPLVMPAKLLSYAGKGWGWGDHRPAPDRPRFPATHSYSSAVYSCRWTTPVLTIPHPSFYKPNSSLILKFLTQTVYGISNIIPLPCHQSFVPSSFYTMIHCYLPYCIYRY